MSKELEAFNRFLKNRYMGDYKGCKYDIETIENALKDYEWLKSVISIDMFDQMPTPEDKVRFLKIMGVKVEYE